MYRGTLPPLLAVLLVAPLLFVVLSVAAAALAAGAAAALILPFFLRRHLRKPEREADYIELSPDQYSRADDERTRIGRDNKS